MSDCDLQADMVTEMRWIRQERLTHDSSSLNLNVIILLDCITTQCRPCQFSLEAPFFIILL